MPPQRTAKAGSSSTATTADKYRKPAKKVKPELPLSVKVQKKWKSIRDQIQDGYPEHALKNVQKVLDLEPSNDLAIHTYIQLLLSLDRYGPALDFIESDETRKRAKSIERAYALYKLGREAEAGQVVDELRQRSTGMTVDNDDDDEDVDRTLDVLDAQIQYRLERFEDAQLMYEDLLATVDEDSPERDDLQTNLSASIAHTDFIASIPSLLGELSSTGASSSTSVSTSGRLPPVDVLESTPIAPLVTSHPLYRSRNNKVVASTSTTTTTPRKAGASTTTKKTKSKTDDTAAGDAQKRIKKVKLPPSIAALPESQRPAPDPERWLPKRERKGYAEILAAKEREKEKKRLKARKKLEATMTQGSDGPADTSKLAVAQAAGQSKGSNNNSNKKKKNGGR